MVIRIVMQRFATHYGLPCHVRGLADPKIDFRHGTLDSTAAHSSNGSPMLATHDFTFSFGAGLYLFTVLQRPPPS